MKKMIFLSIACLIGTTLTFGQNKKTKDELSIGIIGSGTYTDFKDWTGGIAAGFSYYHHKVYARTMYGLLNNSFQGTVGYKFKEPFSVYGLYEKNLSENESSIKAGFECAAPFESNEFLLFAEGGIQHTEEWKFVTTLGVALHFQQMLHKRRHKQHHR